MRVNPRQAAREKMPDMLVRQPRQGIKCPGYAATTP
jgi:hypothetical protein